MATWQCIKHCGACCQLDPRDRPDLADYLAANELQHYLSLVGEDGWCIHYNQDNCTCQIYTDRPRFCRVEPETFSSMYGIEPEALNDFAIDCCQQQITGVYGPNCPELSRFKQAVGIKELSSCTCRKGNGCS